MKIRKLTMGQAVVQFLTKQYVERDGIERAFFAGMLVFRTRECRRDWSSTASIFGCVSFLSNTERTINGAYCCRVCENE